MSDPADAVQQPTDETGEVRADLACQRCGYNLRGLNASGQCPECGTPISLSLHKDLLCFAEPGYVKGLAIGCRRILAGVTILLFTLLLAFAGSLAALHLQPSGTAQQVWRALGMVVLSAGTALGILAFLYGVWLITRPQPQMFTTLKRDTVRRFVRICLLVAVVGEALSYCVGALGTPLRMLAFFELLGIVVSVFGVVGITAYFMYVRSVAQRVSMTSRGRYTEVPEYAKFLAYGFAIALGLVALVNAVEAISLWGPVLFGPAGPSGGPFASPGGAPFPTPGAVGACLRAPAGLALLILFLVAARLHYRLRDALEREATQAAQHWSDASAEVGT